MNKKRSTKKEKRIMQILDIVCAEDVKTKDAYKGFDKIKVGGEKYLDMMYDFFNCIEEGEEGLIPLHFASFNGYVNFLLSPKKMTYVQKFHQELFNDLR